MKLLKEKFVVKHLGRNVSWCFLIVVKLPSRKLAIIEEVYTLEAFRKQGFATQVVKEAIERARDFNCDCVELNVRNGNEGFYTAMGFVDRMNKALRLVL
jgi:GNAT superfamily N-acetyltransferase